MPEKQRQHTDVCFESKQQSRATSHTSHRQRAIGASLWLSPGPTKLYSCLLH